MIRIAPHTVHDIVDGELRERTRRRLEEIIPKQAATGIPPLGRFLSTFRMEAGAFLGRNDAPWVRRLVTALGELGTAVFSSSQRTGPVSFPFEGKTVAGLGAPAHFSETPHVWTLVFFANQCVRNQTALDTQLREPTEQLANAPGDRDTYHLPFVEALRLFARDDAAWKAAARTAMDLMAPDKLRIATPKSVAPNVAILKALDAIHERSQMRFTDALVEALEAHKAMWSKGSASSDPAGLIALEAAGTAALGITRGLQFEVETPYAPRWLVENTTP